LKRISLLIVLVNGKVVRVIEKKGIAAISNESEISFLDEYTVQFTANGADGPLRVDATYNLDILSKSFTKYSN
jgi:hypothetical protein